MPGASLLSSDLTADQLKAIQGGGLTTNVGGNQVVTTHANSGQQGVDAMIGGGNDAVTGFTAFDPAHQKQGDLQAQFDASGKYTGTQAMTGGTNWTGKDFGDILKGAATIAAFAVGANMLFPAAGLGGTSGVSALGGVEGGSSDIMGNLSGRIPDALDSVPVGGDGGAYTANANYSLTSASGGNGMGAAGEGNAGQGMNLAGRTGEGIEIQGNAPNMTSMGGGQGLTVPEGQTVGDAGSFINDPANRSLLGPNGTVSETAVTSPSHLTDLGDPNSFINGGTEGVDAGGTPAGGGGPPGGGVVTPSGGITDILKPIAPIIPSIVNLLSGALTPSQPKQQPQTPTQPEVGAGSYANANAQGGTSGSMLGVAGTLLTAKDTFGYGKSMLG